MQSWCRISFRNRQFEEEREDIEEIVERMRKKYKGVSSLGQIH